MRQRLQYSIYTAFTILLIGCAQSRPMKMAHKVDEPFPVRIVEVAGSPDQMGATHAQQLSGPIHQLFATYFAEYFSSKFERSLALTAASAYASHVSPPHLEEIRALARGTGLQEREVLLGQCFLDLSKMTACSTITLPASASPDGIARFGRNLDFPSFDIADRQSVVLIFRPEGRYAFASIAWPGMIGVLSGMNEHGLTLANMEVDRGRRLPSAMPYTLLYRTVLEQCRTVDEAIALLEKTPRQTANNLMLMDASGDRAVAEITPGGVTVRRAPANAALISTNHQRGDKDLDTRGRCERFDALHAASAGRFGQIDVARLEKMLGRVAQGNMTLQSMVFEPSTRTLILATGADAPKQGYHGLNLRTYFSNGGLGVSPEHTP